MNKLDKGTNDEIERYNYTDQRSGQHRSYVVKHTKRNVNNSQQHIRKSLQETVRPWDIRRSIRTRGKNKKHRQITNLNIRPEQLNWFTSLEKFKRRL